MKFFQVWVENSPPLIRYECFHRLCPPQSDLEKPARWIHNSWMPPGCNPEEMWALVLEFPKQVELWGVLTCFAPCRGRMDVLDAMAGWFSCLTFVWFWSHVCVYDFWNPFSLWYILSVTASWCQKRLILRGHSLQPFVWVITALKFLMLPMHLLPMSTRNFCWVLPASECCDEFLLELAQVIDNRTTTPPKAAGTTQLVLWGRVGLDLFP